MLLVEVLHLLPVAIVTRDEDGKIARDTTGFIEFTTTTTSAKINGGTARKGSNLGKK